MSSIRSGTGRRSIRASHPSDSWVLATAVSALVALLLLIGILARPEAALAATSRWEIRPGSKGTEVVFSSKAPMESFDGRTEQVAGFIRLDPHALTDSIEVAVEVDLASLDTGISLRNKHMRENHLETETYPRATFHGARLTGFPDVLAVGEAATGIARGSFDLHGIVRPIEAKATLTLNEDGTLAVNARFEVFLADHEIDRPKFLMLKLDEKQRVNVELLAEPTTSEETNQ